MYKLYVDSKLKIKISVYPYNAISKVFTLYVAMVVFALYSKLKQIFAL
jgi:hypothetical protein